MKTIVKIFIAIIIIEVIFCAIWRFTHRDIPPINDEDLKITLEDIPNDENAYYYFDKASEALVWPEDKSKLIYEILYEEEWDENFVKDLLNKNEEVFSCINKGLSCRYVQFFSKLGIDSLTPWVEKWRDIAKLGLMKALLLFKSGNEEQAFNELKKIIQFGHMIERIKGGTLISYTTGWAIKYKAMDRLRQFLGSTNLRPNILMNYAKKLKKYNFNEEVFANTLKGSYTAVSEIFDMPLNRIVTEILDVESKQFNMMRGSFMYQPNRTKEYFADNFRLYIDKEHKNPKNIDPDLFLYYHCQPGFRSFMQGNMTGKILFRLLMPSLGYYANNRHKEDFNVNATQLLIALKCYKIDNGKLPESLDELVPKYIEEIPKDPYGGEPIKYSAEKRLIYREGKDLEEIEKMEDGYEKDKYAFTVDFQ